MTTAIANQSFERHGASPWATLRWGLCLAIILALHAGAAWLSLHWRQAAKAAPASPPAAIMIDLAPLPSVAPAPPNEIPPGPKQEVSEPPPPEPEIQPSLPPAPSTAAPTPAVPVPPNPKPVPRKRQERVVPYETPKRRPTREPPAQATTAPPQTEAPPAPTSAAPAPGRATTSPTNAIPTWQALLLGRLEHFKRYPSVAQFRHQQGVAYLRFAIDRHGKVLSASIDKSSGVDALDEETLALIQRADPLPAPPPEVPGDPVELVVPVQFFIK